MPRILVVEDEPKVLRGLERVLGAEGFTVSTAWTGEEGYRKAAAETFDCIVLDWMLPRRTGLQVLRDLRRSDRQAPVLLLTARDAVEDRVVGLDAGADDYLVKPFALAELLARVRALLRRGGDREAVLRAGDLELDLLQRKVSRAGREVSLSAREFEVLEYLVRHRDAVVSRDMLGRDVWKEPGHSLTNVIDVYVNFLRRKLERPGLQPLIQTIRGVGYLLRS